MKNSNFGMVGWLVRLMMVVCLMFSSASFALAFDVSGTVSNTTGKTGRIYLSVRNTMYSGGTPVAGVSIPSAGVYTIRGLTDPGSYEVSAFVDTEGNGIRLANAPVGTSTTFTDASPSGVNFAVALPSPAVALQPPVEAKVVYGDTTATIFYRGASDNNGNRIATSYNVYWSTTSNPGPSNYNGRTLGIPADSHELIVKYGLASPASQYNFAITAVLDSEESAPSNAIAALPTTGVNVSGTVTTSGIALPVNPSHLLMVLMNENAGVFITSSLVNPTNSQAFSFSGVPTGTYNLYTIIDLGDSGLIDLGDIHDTEVGVPVTVASSDVSGVAIALTAADAFPYVQTKHYNNLGDSYSLTLGTASMRKRPVNVAVSGPQISTRDIGMSDRNNGTFETSRNVASRPNFPTSPDTYSFTIEYSSGSGSSPLTAHVTGIVDYFATPTTPLGVISYPAPNPLHFSWAPPAPGPAYPFTYRFWLNNPNGWFDSDQYESMPSSTTSLDISNSNFNPQMGINYNWGIAIKDINGNSSESYGNFSTGGFGTISGKVTSDGSHGIANTYAVLLDSITGKPAANVQAVQTDINSGAFFIGSVPPGNYKIYFSAGPGFQGEFYNDQASFNTAQLLSIFNEDNLNNVNAELAAAPNTGTIVGHVVNASDGQPVLNARVELLNAGNSSFVTDTYTTSNGDFQISALNPGSYKLRISANGFRTIAPVTAYLVQSGVSTQAFISLPNTVTYTSRVVNSSNAGIDGAQIDLIVGGNTTTNVASTDSNGYFTIIVPFSTSFYLRISKATFVTTYTSAMSNNQDSSTSDRPYTLLTPTGYDGMFTPASSNSVAKIAGTGSISARVASAGNPLMTLPGVTVTASDGTTTYPVCYNDGSVNCTGLLTETKDNGRFYVLNVPDGKQITVTATKGGYNSGSRIFPVVADSASLGRVGLQTSTTSYTIISKLVNFNTGAPVNNNTITLFKDDNSTVGQVNTDSNGLFTAADLVSGNYYFKLSDGTSYLESYSANTTTPSSNANRSARPYFSYTLNQITTWGFNTLNAVITGTIKDNLTGAPIAGATITTTAGSIKYDDGTGNPSSSATSTSSANGRFYIYNIPASSSDNNTTVTVTVTAAPGYNLSGGGGATRVCHVKNGALTEGNFNFNLLSSPTMVNISGSVSDSSSLPLAGASVAAHFLPSWGMINNPVLTDNTGKFSMNVPSGSPFALEFTSFGYRNVYSQDIQTSQPITLATYPLLTTGDYSQLGWPLTAGKTFIRGLVFDNLFRPLDGVLVTPTPGTYTVNYVDDADNKTLMTGGTTFTNGMFVLPNVTSSDYVSLTPTKDGKSFWPISFSHMVADTDSLGGAFDNTPAPGYLSASPSFVNFGSVNVGGGPFTQIINITNSGPGNISVSSSDMTGDVAEISINPGGPTPCPSLPATLVPGACTLVATYSPTSTGQKSATMTINSNATSGPVFSVPLSGNGIATAPGIPTINSIVPWDGQATITFSAPSDNGGSPIIDYAVTANPGNIVINPAVSPLTITGLTNNTLYTFSVAARNSVGTGTAATTTTTPIYAPLRIGTTGYANLQAAFTAVTANGEIKGQTGIASIPTPPFLLSKGVTITGGYNSTYGGFSGFTSIPGRVNIKGTGVKVIFKYVKVKAP